MCGVCGIAAPGGGLDSARGEPPRPRDDRRARSPRDRTTRASTGRARRCSGRRGSRSAASRTAGSRWWTPGAASWWSATVRSTTTRASGRGWRRAGAPSPPRPTSRSSPVSTSSWGTASSSGWSESSRSRSGIRERAGCSWPATGPGSARSSTASGTAMVRFATEIAALASGPCPRAHAGPARPRPLRPLRLLHGARDAVRRGPQGGAGRGGRHRAGPGDATRRYWRWPIRAAGRSPTVDDVRRRSSGRRSAGKPTWRSSAGCS